MSTVEDQSHWEKVYETKAAEEVSWFQPYPETSMEFLKGMALPNSANIIDVGGGDSSFVDALLEAGYENIWVLDISANAIERAKKRLGAEKASKVNWVVSDVVDFVPSVKFDFWHDRAAFHFLTKEEQVEKYVLSATEFIKKDGYLILGTFSDSGPEKCSGLQVRQYSEVAMSSRFESDFTRIRCLKKDHVTPAKNVQNFLFCSFRKK